VEPIYEIKAGGVADLVAILMQLSDAGDNSGVRNKFLSSKNTIYEDESIDGFV
jgi:hypothetical protein